MATKKQLPQGTEGKKWEKGAPSPNPNGRPKGSGRPTSHLRRTLAKLRDMEEKALKNIEASIDKEAVDKEALATSKWLVTTMVTLNRAAIADEQLSFSVKAYNEEKQEEKREGTTGNVIRFTTRMADVVDSGDEEE